MCNQTAKKIVDFCSLVGFDVKAKETSVCFNQPNNLEECIIMCEILKLCCFYFLNFFYFFVLTTINGQKSDSNADPRQKNCIFNQPNNSEECFDHNQRPLLVRKSAFYFSFLLYSVIVGPISDNREHGTLMRENWENRQKIQDSESKSQTLCVIM